MRQDITLDVRKRETSFGRAKLLPLRRGEKGNRELVVSVEEDGRAYDLSDKTASLVATTAAGKLVGPCPMEVAEAGIARIMLPAALYSAVGAFTGYVEIREGETLVDTTDSFGGKVIECADLDSEQAAEFTPLLGELQNAVAEEVKRAEAETERATGFAEAKRAAHAATTAANDAATKAKSAADSASDAAKSANTAAGKATNAAAKAESDVRAFVNAAGTAVGDAIAAAREDVDAAVKRSDAATAKAEAAVETADSANTAATKAVTDARDAIADVKATEAKLYPAAENILVGSETGAVAHVEDAFAGATLRKIVVEGACKQDGTPSPEAPVPIQVVEHPVLMATGRNLLNPEQLAADAPHLYSADGGRLTVKASDGRAWNMVDPSIALHAGTYYASGDGFEIRDELNNSIINSSGRFTLARDSRLKIKVGTSALAYPYVSKAQIERGGAASDYAPHTSQTLTFALPAEHSYLAKLPDGTADEIVVDEEGNVELVARVSKATLVASKIVDEWGKGNALYNFPRDGRYSTGEYFAGKAVICQALEAVDGNDIYKGATVGISVGSSMAHLNQCDTVLYLGDNVDASAVDGASFYYPLMTPVTYSLGKMDIPKAQDSIVNAWTDAEVTPNTGIKYVRDVNIVVANIEKAIASITEG